MVQSESSSRRRSGSSKRHNEDDPELTAERPSSRSRSASSSRLKSRSSSPATIVNDPDFSKYSGQVYAGHSKTGRNTAKPYNWEPTSEEDFNTLEDLYTSGAGTEIPDSIKKLDTTRGYNRFVFAPDDRNLASVSFRLDKAGKVTSKVAKSSGLNTTRRSTKKKEVAKVKATKEATFRSSEANTTAEERFQKRKPSSRVTYLWKEPGDRDSGLIAELQPTESDLSRLSSRTDTPPIWLMPKGGTTRAPYLISYEGPNKDGKRRRYTWEAQSTDDEEEEEESEDSGVVWSRSRISKKELKQRIKKMRPSRRGNRNSKSSKSSA